MRLVTLLQGKRSKEGHSPRILLGGVTLGHLEKTTLAYIKEQLDNSATPYTHDKKNNRLVVGDVTTILVPISAPELIVGFDCCFGKNTKIFVRKNLTKVIKKRIVNICEGDEVYTRRGWRKVTKIMCRGVRETISAGGQRVTPDHLVWDNLWRRVDEAETLLQINAGEIKVCERGKEIRKALRESLSSIKGCFTTDTLTARGMIREVILKVRLARSFMLRYGKNTTESCRTDVAYTIKTLTRLITALRTYKCSLKANIRGSITKSVITSLKEFLASVKGAAAYLSAGKEPQSTVSRAEKKYEGNITRGEGTCLGRGRYTIIDARGAAKNGGKTENVLSALNDVLTLLDTRTRSPTTKNIGRTVPVVSAEKNSGLLNLQKHRRVPHTVKISKEDRHYEDVYDISVEGEHEFFTESFLAHNCYSLIDEADDASGSGIATDITFEAIRAVNERTRQIIPGFRKPGCSIASTSQGIRGLYRVYTNFIKAGTAFTLIRGHTKDNWYLDPEYVESLYRVYSPTERKVFLEGAFLALSQGRILGDFDWDRNYVDADLDLEIAPSETILWTQDFNEGMHRGCAAVVRDNILYIIKSYEFPNIREAPRVLHFDFPRNRIIWLPDATAKDQILQFTRELRKHNIWWIIRKSNPSVEDTAFLVNALLHTGRLIFTRAAKDHAEDAALGQRDKHGEIPKGKGPSSPIHRIDNIRLAGFFAVCMNYSMRDIYRATVEKHLDQWKNSQTPDVEDLGNGFSMINPAALR